MAFIWVEAIRAIGGDPAVDLHMHGCFYKSLYRVGSLFLKEFELIYLLSTFMLSAAANLALLEFYSWAQP